MYYYYATYTQVQHNRRCPGELVGRQPLICQWLAQVKIHRVDFLLLLQDFCCWFFSCVDIPPAVLALIYPLLIFAISTFLSLDGKTMER